MLLPMTPGATATIAVSNSSGRVALGTSPIYTQIMVTSVSGGAVAFIKFGDSTVAATTSDTPILPGSIQTFTVVGATYVAAITAASTATLYFTVGQGT